MRIGLISDLILGLAVAVIAVIFFTYVGTYFFLFDDFALVGEASSAQDVFARPLFGFYRPIVFVLVNIETRVFSWATPGGYIAVSQAWHVANALLLFALLRQLRQSRRPAAIGALLFLLSPWASETYFWLSARFDVQAAFGLLACLVCGLAMVDASGGRRQLALGLGGSVAAAFGLLAKENAIVIPTLTAVAFLTVPPRERLRRFPPWVYVAALFGLASIYLVARSRVLPGLAGAYGTGIELFRWTDVVSNALSYVAAFVTVPFPGISPGEWPPTPLIAVCAVVFLSLGWQAWRADRRLVMLSCIGFVLTLAPVVWIAMPVGSSAAGRLRYLPRAWVALLLGAGIGHLGASAHSRRRVAVFAATLLTVVLPSLISIHHQARAWQRATTLAHEAIQQFRPLLNQGLRQVYIPNLPFWFAEGPYVLKDYAFRYYFSGSDVPAVRTRNMVLSAGNGKTQFARWVEPAATPIASGEHLFQLNLSISGIPPLVSVDPQRLSVFVSRDEERSSNGSVALTGAEVGAWRIENPAPELFTIQPTRGTGAATLRIEGRTTAPVMDRKVRVPVYSGHENGPLETSFTVRFKVVEISSKSPPFGSVPPVPANPVSLSSNPVVFQGWALDDFNLRGVWAEAFDAEGRLVALGQAIRGGMRPDVAALHPDAHDIYNSGWNFTLEPSALTSLSRPIVVRFYAEDGDGLRAEIGVRTLK